MLNIKITVLVIIAIMSVNSVFAENPTRKAQRVESIRAKHIKLFEEIQDAFDSGDHAEVRTLLNRLSLETKPGKKGEDYRFHTLLSEGNISEAKKVAGKLLEKDDLHIMGRATIYKALGDAYYARDNLDGALAQYKKIIELRDN